MTPERSLEYLASDRALEAIRTNVYWPKWDSPWWHMTLLWEMGRARDIPRRAIDAMVEGHQKDIVHFFPMSVAELPPGKDIYRDVACHCGLGTTYQILSEAGVDVDAALPWARPWFLRYQMPDGGLSCDEAAYPRNESSIVGTLPPLEAVLLHTRREFTAEEIAFLDRGAQCLIDRALMRGSHAEEREDEADWLKPCFPRFYLYDVLRGLSWLLKWSEIRGKPLPREAVMPVARILREKFPDGQIRKERLSYDGMTTLLLKDGAWVRRQPATLFPLLEQVSRVGEVSPWLSAQWADCQVRLTRAGL